jgi:hypothetical protein
MSLKSVIIDGTGTNRAVAVTENNALRVQLLPETSKGVPSPDLSNLRQLREYLVNGISPDMNVNGSVTNVTFNIVSIPGFTQWINGIRIFLEDASLEINTADFRRFGTATGGGTPLTNGILIQTVQSGETVDISNEPIRFLGDFLKYADSFTNLINSVSSTEDYIHFDINFDKPVVLTSGGSDSLKITIRDNLTSINTFRCIARGYKESV